MSILAAIGRLSLLPVLFTCWNLCGFLDFISYVIGGTFSPYKPTWRLSNRIMGFVRAIMIEFN